MKPELELSPSAFSNVKCKKKGGNARVGDLEGAKNNKCVTGVIEIYTVITLKPNMGEEVNETKDDNFPFTWAIIFAIILL